MCRKLVRSRPPAACGIRLPMSYNGHSTLDSKRYRRPCPAARVLRMSSEAYVFSAFRLEDFGIRAFGVHWCVVVFLSNSTVTSFKAFGFEGFRFNGSSLQGFMMLLSRYRLLNVGSCQRLPFCPELNPQPIW